MHTLIWLVFGVTLLLFIIRLSFAVITGIFAMAFFLCKMMPYYRTSTDRSKLSHRITTLVVMILLATAMFLLCILIHRVPFAAYLTAITGVIALCVAIKKRLMVPISVNLSPLTIEIVIGMILIAVSVANLAIYAIKFAALLLAIGYIPQRPPPPPLG